MALGGSKLCLATYASLSDAHARSLKLFAIAIISIHNVQHADDHKHTTQAMRNVD